MEEFARELERVAAVLTEHAFVLRQPAPLAAAVTTTAKGTTVMKVPDPGELDRARRARSRARGEGVLVVTIASALVFLAVILALLRALRVF